MATSAGKSKPAMDTLIRSFEDVVSQAQRRMSEKEFKQAERKFDQVVTKVRASRGRRRETA
jgi:hypothetical protein